MEVSSVGPKNLKIKSKNANFIINPTGKVDTEVVIFTDKPGSYTGMSQNLIIDGPGEYEVSGVSIKGEKTGSGVSFDFLEENQNLLVLANTAAAKSKDVEGYTAVVVLADDKVDNALASLTSEVIAVAGTDEVLPSERENVRKVEKLNLKKVEEYKGLIVHLSK